jgi:hypothetical protein
MVWASLLKEPLEVVCGCPCEASDAACGGRDAPHARAARFPAVVLIVTGCGHGP